MRYARTSLHLPSRQHLPIVGLILRRVRKRARGVAAESAGAQKSSAQESTHDDRYVNIRHFFEATNSFIESARKARGIALVHCNSASFSRAAAISMGTVSAHFFHHLAADAIGDMCELSLGARHVPFNPRVRPSV